MASSNKIIPIGSDYEYKTDEELIAFAKKRGARSTRAAV